MSTAQILRNIAAGCGDGYAEVSVSTKLLREIGFPVPANASRATSVKPFELAAACDKILEREAAEAIDSAEQKSKAEIARKRLNAEAVAAAAAVEPAPVVASPAAPVAKPKPTPTAPATEPAGDEPLTPQTEPAADPAAAPNLL